MPNKHVTVTLDDRVLRSIIAKLDRQQNLVKVIADGVEYGVYVHEGTIRMPGRLFLAEAVEAHRKTIVAAFKAATPEQYPDALTKAAEEILRTAQQDTPVDTGALRASLHIVEGDTSTFERVIRV